jgi:1,4-dihydroxy-2-naphthoate octaprenyltransferase
LPLASLPAGVALARRLFRSPPAAMNPVLERTAQLLMVFGILFAVGLAL